MTAASVILCTKDRADFLSGALQSIRDATIGIKGVDVMVVEQGTAAADGICREVGLDATVIRDHGIGASRARNIGITSTDSDVVLFTDDDCEVPKTWVTDHLEALRDPELAATFGRVVGLSGFGGEDPVGIPAIHRRGSFPWLIGHSSNMAARRSVLIDLGGFDERLGPGSRGNAIGEDADLIFRMLRRGHALRSGVGAPVRHLEWRSETESRRTLRAYERGAGAWIGKALRSDRASGVVPLKHRIWMLEERARNNPGVVHDPLAVTGQAAAFVAGCVRGLALSPWPERTVPGEEKTPPSYEPGPAKKPDHSTDHPER